MKWPRVIAGDHGLPATFADQTAPLLVFLDRARIRYDLTSDIALARSRDPRATDREGVVLAGSLRWVPRTLARRLRRYVEDGGRLASFGTESLRRGVRVGTNRLTRPTQPTPTDPFGARLEPLARPRPGEDGGGPVPLTALADDPALGLLTGSDGVVDAFGRIEESQARVELRRAKVVMALGQDVTEAERADAEAKGEQPRQALPALTATRLEKGYVVRVGLTDWVKRAEQDREVAQITRNIIDVLRRVKPRLRSGEPALEDPELHHAQPQRRDVEVGRHRERERRALRRGEVQLLEPRALLGLRLAVPELGARVAREQRAAEIELQRVEDRDGGRRAGQPHPLRLADGEARREAGREARHREPRGVDGDGAGGAQQLARLRLEVKALEGLGQQQNEQLLFHRSLTL